MSQEEYMEPVFFNQPTIALITPQKAEEMPSKNTINEVHKGKQETMHVYKSWV